MKVRKSGKYVLIRDLVIPAGTVFQQAPVKVTRAPGAHIEAVFGLSKNTSGSITYAVDADKGPLSMWFRDLDEIEKAHREVTFAFRELKAGVGRLDGAAVAGAERAEAAVVVPDENRRAAIRAAVTGMLGGE